MQRQEGAARIAVVVKGYPRLSETFIAQEILGLESRGVGLAIWSLRQPTEAVVHPMNRQIRARVSYLPEYLYREPLRVLRGAAAAFRRPGWRRLLATATRDLRRDPTPNRLRRIGQAFVLARELPDETEHLHVHYLHTPCSVVRYAAILRDLPWSFSAHAKDIWTLPAWEKREKLAEAAWGVTCTRQGAAHLQDLSPEAGHVRLLYHGLDLSRFPRPPLSRPARDGSDPGDPVRIVAVGRAVEKKGFADALRALAALPSDLHWRFAHVGGGEGLAGLKALAGQLGIADKVAWLGSKAQPDVVALLREADIFCLPAKAAPNGDQDGLPNVLMEAASQALAILSTRFAGIVEFVRDGQDGDLVEPGDWEALSNAINRLARDPPDRERLGRSAYRRLAEEFGADRGLDWLATRLGGAAEPQGTRTGGELAAAIT